MNELGTRLRELRIGQGVSQRSLARRAGTTQSAVSLIERGLTSPRWETVRSLMLALGYEAGLEGRRLETRADPLQIHAIRRRDPADRLALAISANRLSAKLAGAGGHATR